MTKENLIVELFNEHEAIKEELDKLPEIGKIIEIHKRDTSGKRGAYKGTTALYKVENITVKNKLVELRQVKTNVRESFSFFDLTKSAAVKLHEIEV